MSQKEGLFDYESEKDSAMRARARIKQHDGLIRVIRGIVKNLLPKINAAADWVTVVNKRVKTLKIYEIDQDGNSINLLLDKCQLYRRLVHISIKNGVYTANKIVWLRRFKDMLPDGSQMNEYNFEELCSSMIDKAEQFKVSPDKITDWRCKLLKLGR